MNPPVPVSEASHLYYSADILPTNSVLPTGVSLDMQFNDNRTMPIIDDMSQYELSIVRFQADCGSLPLWIPIVQSTPYTNQTIYSVVVRTVETLPSGGENETTSDPVYLLINNPDSTLVAGDHQDFSNPYYYVNTFAQFCDMVNTAIQTAFAQAAAGIAGIYPPRIVYNSDTNRFRIYFDDQALSEGVVLTLMFNQNLAEIVRHIPYQKATVVGVDNDDVYWIVPVVPNMGLNSYMDPTNSNRLWHYTEQERDSTDIFSPVSSVVFVTSIPIYSEIVAPAVSLDSAARGIASTSVITDRIITDIMLPLSNGAYDYKGLIAYLPDQLRVTSMTGAAASLMKFQVSLYWKCNINGQLYPIKALNNSRASIKCLFNPKSY